MEKIEKWIMHDENRWQLAEKDMTLILHEMLAKNVGLKGSNVFTKTYPFVASVGIIKSLRKT